MEGPYNATIKLLGPKNMGTAGSLKLFYVIREYYNNKMKKKLFSKVK